MKGTRRAALTALGRCVPERVLTNADLERKVATSDEWIRTRTGIRERHVVEPGTPASALAVAAARRALDSRGIGADTLDLIVVATVTPDMIFPATACLVQDQLGASRAWGFDVSAACSGFTYALTVGAQFVAAGSCDRVLVIGADVMSAIVDWEDRATCVLFGDAAGAVLLEPAGSEDEGILDFSHKIEGWGGPHLMMPAGGSARPASAETVRQRQHFVHQEGQAVFKYAVREMADVASGLLERNGFGPEQLDLFVPHQANIRIIDAAQHRLGLPDARVVKNIDRYGNTTAATIPLALGSALEEGRLKQGDLVLMAAVGAGFTVGGVLLRWGPTAWS